MAAPGSRRHRRADGDDDDDGREVVLRSFDGVRLAVRLSLALPRSRLVAAAAAEAGEGVGRVVVEVPGNVPGRNVAKVAGYWEAREAIEEAVGDEVAAFDAGFLDGLSHDARVDLIHAAFHLADHALLNLFRFGP
ncbi:hypothetical protein ACP70R_018923 [Stipagrostis hirtigluma subsp. patula]